jgi:hypothetical protein
MRSQTFRVSLFSIRGLFFFFFFFFENRLWCDSKVTIDQCALHMQLTACKAEELLSLHSDSKSLLVEESSLYSTVLKCTIFKLQTAYAIAQWITAPV